MTNEEKSKEIADTYGMTNKEKIKAEIEQRIKVLERNQGYGIGVDAQINAYGSLLDFIKSMPKEPKFKNDPTINMIQWKGNNLKEVIEFTGKYHKFNDWFKSWQDYEDYVHTHDDIFKLFDEEGNHYEVPLGAWIVKTPDGYNIASRAKFFKNRYEKSLNIDCSEEPVSEDLDEAAKQSESQAGRLLFPYQTGFKAGANWQKEQMTKQAVYGIVTWSPDAEGLYLGSGVLRIKYNKAPQGNPKEGDKVKLIIVKED